MLNKTDLTDAVGEGIITAEQADQLSAFSKRLSSGEHNLLEPELETRDEPFRLLRGFRDVFIALGVLFLAIGASRLYMSLVFLSSQGPVDIDEVLTNPVRLFASIAGALLLLLVGVVIAEIVTKKLRLPLSSLVLSVAVAFWCGLLGTLVLGNLAPPVYEQWNGSTPDFYIFLYLFFFFGAFVGISIFYARYKLPFITLVIAGSLVGLVFTLWKFLVPDVETGGHRVFLGVLGLLVFCAAMYFDTKDRLRVSRLSENAFWLHLLAAPLMIHSLFAPSWSGEVNTLLVLVAFTVLTLVALVIDRRALLVSSLIYLANAFGRIIQDLHVNSAFNFTIPILFIGVLVLVLGIGWSPLRRIVMKMMPSSISSRTPPVALTHS